MLCLIVLFKVQFQLYSQIFCLFTIDLPRYYSSHIRGHSAAIYLKILLICNALK